MKESQDKKFLNKKLTFKNKLKFLQVRNHPVFGEINVYSMQHQKFNVFSKQFKTNLEKLAIFKIQKIQKRKNLNNPFLLRFLDYEAKIEENLCSKQYVLTSYYLLPRYTLQDLQEIQRKKGFFVNSTQLNRITQMLMASISILHEKQITHKNIRLEQIGFDLKSQGVYLIDFLGEDWIKKQQDYIVTHQKLFLSPEVFRKVTLDQKKEVDLEWNDYFAASLIILQKGTKYVGGKFYSKDGNFNWDQLKKQLAEFKKNHGSTNPLMVEILTMIFYQQFAKPLFHQKLKNYLGVTPKSLTYNDYFVRKFYVKVKKSNNKKQPRNIQQMALQTVVKQESQSFKQQEIIEMPLVVHQQEQSFQNQEMVKSSKNQNNYEQVNEEVKETSKKQKIIKVIDKGGGIKPDLQTQSSSFKLISKITNIYYRVMEEGEVENPLKNQSIQKSEREPKILSCIVHESQKKIIEVQKPQKVTKSFQRIISVRRDPREMKISRELVKREFRDKFSINSHRSLSLNEKLGNQSGGKKVLDIGQKWKLKSKRNKSSINDKKSKQGWLNFQGIDNESKDSSESEFNSQLEINSRNIMEKTQNQIYENSEKNFVK